MSNIVFDPVQHVEFVRGGSAAEFIPSPEKTVELLKKHFHGTTTELYMAWGAKSGLPNGGPLLRVRVSVLAGAEPSRPIDSRDSALTVESQTRAWKAFEAECDSLRP